jgi:predicted Zn finger-like uncharacterized protein
MSRRGPPVSKITRCPSCSTAFRVSDAQLQARAGQVRCGRCGAMFDAVAALTTDTAARTGQAEGIRSASGTSVLPGSAFDFGPTGRPGGSRLWWIAIAIAILGLALQAAYYRRTDVGLLFPEASPLIHQLCAQIGCEIPQPRRVELLSIESSDLQADNANPNVMVLTAALRNRAGFVQAFPALELSLTNAQDKTVARRVLMPKDYVPRGTQADSGFAAASDLQVRVYMEAVALRPSGYRLYLFYP